MDAEEPCDALGGGMPGVDFDPSGLTQAAADLLDPRSVATQVPGLFSAWVNAALGLPAEGYPGRDKRFADPTWQENPFYRWLGQSYVAWADMVLRLADSARLDPDRQERARYLARIMTATAAPTNVLPGNPAALKRAFETGGQSLVRGARSMAHDLAVNGGMPSSVDTSGFRVGENLARTPGAVVHGEEMFELLQYGPSTEEVGDRPLLLVPPQVNKHYFLDLAVGRSLVEYTVAQGVQHFSIVWRNPRLDRPQHGRWTLQDYVAAQLRAIDVVREITSSRDVNVVGACAGGLTTAVMMAHLAAIGDDRVHAVAFLITMLDSGPTNLLRAMSGPRTRAKIAQDAEKGVVYEKSSLKRNFAWMRPDDLVFSYVVNNWLLGEKPPAFDILAWNDDSTNLASAFDRDMLSIYAGNLIAKPDELTVLGTPVDLGRVKNDTFVVAGQTDHITPWRPCYQTSQLLGGDSEVVITGTGHIQTIVSPLGKARASYWYGRGDHADPDEWLGNATQESGSWWPRWSEWLRARSGVQRPAPEGLGSQAHPALGPAPGTYVLET